MSLDLARGLLFDTNAVRAGGRDFPKLCDGLGKLGVVCEVPAHVVAEFVRGRAAILSERATAAGLPAVTVSFGDELEKFSSLAVEPFTQADAAALVEWTQEAYGSQDQYARFKTLQAVRGASPAYRGGALECGLMGDGKDADRRWSQLYAAAELFCAEGRFVCKASTNADWLTIGMALARDRWIVTNEGGREFERVQDRCLTFAQLVDDLRGRGV